MGGNDFSAVIERRRAGARGVKRHGRSGDGLARALHVARQLRGPRGNVCQGDGTCRNKRNEALIQKLVFHGRNYRSSLTAQATALKPGTLVSGKGVLRKVPLFGNPL